MSTLDENYFTEAGGFSTNALGNLRSAAPWMRISAVIVLIGALALFIAMLYSLAYTYSLFQMFDSVVVMAIAVLGGIMAVFTFRISSSIYDFAEKKTSAALENYTQLTKIFWRLAGITAIIGLVGFLLFLMLFVFSFGGLA